MTAPRRIHLHIDRLLLHGIEPDQRDAVVAALRAELQRALAAAPAAAALGTSRHLAALPTPTPMSSEATPAALGGHFASQLVQGLKR